MESISAASTMRAVGRLTILSSKMKTRLFLTALITDQPGRFITLSTVTLHRLRHPTGMKSGFCLITSSDEIDAKGELREAPMFWSPAISRSILIYEPGASGKWHGWVGCIEFIIHFIVGGMIVGSLSITGLDAHLKRLD